MSSTNIFDDLYSLSEPYLRIKCASRNLRTTGLKHELVYNLLRANYAAAKSELAQLKSTLPDPVEDFTGVNLFKDILQVVAEIKWLKLGILHCAHMQIGITEKEMNELSEQGATQEELTSVVEDMRSQWEEWTDYGFTH